MTGSEHPGSFVGVVPAAGASRRMGRPKALLELDGETFVARVVRSLGEGGCERILVVAAPGDDALVAAARDAGAEPLTNPEPGEGPITSLRVALALLRDEPVAGIVYLPVDHPLVAPATVRRLLDLAAAGGHGLTLPVLGEKRGHPAVFGPSLFGELADPALEGGARSVVHRHLAEACLVQVDDPGVTGDIDTPEAYRAITEGAR